MLTILKNRFLENGSRHPGMDWEQVQARLLENPEALAILGRMEETGGEPDAIGFDEAGRVIFCDCAKETPAGRRSLCYDEEALKKRAKNPPSGSAMRQAETIGVSVLDEAMYRLLQSRGAFDCKTSSWIVTPDAIRRQGGALFCERRYGTVFTFHNGADSYYSVRGWRGYLSV